METHTSGDTIALTVNGRERSVPAGVTLLGLLEHLDLDPRTVVVERNRGIVRRPALADVRVEAGDTIEIVHFVGGG